MSDKRPPRKEYRKFTLTRGTAPHSDLDLAAELDDAVGRDAKELGRVERVVGHQDEEPIAPAPEGRSARAAHSFSRPMTKDVSIRLKRKPPIRHCARARMTFG